MPKTPPKGVDPPQVPPKGKKGDLSPIEKSPFEKTPVRNPGGFQRVVLIQRELIQGQSDPEKRLSKRFYYCYYDIYHKFCNKDIRSPKINSSALEHIKGESKYGEDI